MAMKEKGFTLIELMLVIAIITSLSMVGMTAYRQQLANFQVDKTALQLQQWLQAGQAYYQDCGCWPTPNTDPTLDGMNQLMGQTATCKFASPTPTPSPCVDRSLELGKVTYMPVGSNTGGPFRNSYQLSAAQKAGDKLFHIMTGQDVPIPLKLAPRVAGRLPLAILEGSTIIDAQVGAIGESGKKKGIMIMSIFYQPSTTAGATITKPICPPGLVPYMYMAPTIISVDRNYSSPSIGGGNFFSAYIVPPAATQDDPTVKEWTGVQVAANRGEQAKKERPVIFTDTTQMLVITTCEPKKSTSDSGPGLKSWF